MSIAVPPETVEQITAEAVALRARRYATAIKHSESGKSKSFRYDSLDMWRGVACLLVVLHHSTIVFLSSHAASDSQRADELPMTLLQWLHLGNIGVPMFFVISGYCIAATARSAQ